jgi:protein SEY1
MSLLLVSLLLLPHNQQDLLIATVLRNPLYFMFLLLIGAGAYITYQLNLWGPIINMTRAASAQAVEEGRRVLREFLENSETGRQALGMQEPRRGMRRLNSGDDDCELDELDSPKRRGGERRKLKTDGAEDDME